MNEPKPKGSEKPSACDLTAWLHAVCIAWMANETLIRFTADEWLAARRYWLLANARTSEHRI